MVRFQMGMMPLVCIVIGAATVEGHREPTDRDHLSTSDSSSSLDSDDFDEERVHRRAMPGEGGHPQWQYEGMPIEVPTNHTTTTTTATKATTTTTVRAFPPLDARYRRIYNPDERAEVDDHPFMAAVLVNKQLWCGAVILARDRVLTAAHCLQLQYNNRFFREYVKMLTVRVGSTNATAGGDVLRVTEISFHPNYKPATLEFNAALLRLHKNLTLGNRDAPLARLPYATESNIPVDNNILFLGWGSTLGNGGTGQTLLQKVELPIYDLADCQEVYGRQLVTRANFCAGYITLAKNVCNHDAGGPALLDNRLAGILSFSSKRCDRPDEPAVFTAVGPLAEWLDEQLGALAEGSSEE